MIDYQSYMLLGSTEHATTGDCDICAYPVNFRQDPSHPPQALSNGVLHFEYLWDSSDATASNRRILHLMECSVWEHVEYPPPYQYYTNDPNHRKPKYIPASP